MKKADNKDEKLNMNLSWKILDETTVIKDSWIDMRASTCQLPGGMVIAPFYVNHLPDFAVVVAVTPEHRVIMVRQYRHGVEKVLLELPAGCIEAGEDPKDGAARELLEETGYKAGSLEFLFKIAPNASNCTSYAQCYLARNVFPAAAQNLDETEALEVVEMEGEEVKRLLREGGVEQAVQGGGAGGIRLNGMNVPLMLSCFIIVSCPVGSIDRACFGVSVFGSPLDFGNLGLLIFGMVHFVVVLGSVIISVVRAGSSHSCFCHDDTSFP